MQRLLCLWLLLACILGCFGLSLGVTWRSDHFCYAGVCGSWLFPTQARIHVGVWYAWLLISIFALALRATNRCVRAWMSKGFMIPKLGTKITVGGLVLVLWQAVLYAVLLVNWWPELRRYFTQRGHGLPGNVVVAFVAQSGHLADVTMGLVLLPVTRHGALAQFFKLQPSTNFFFHMCQAYLLFILVFVHGISYAGWVWAGVNKARDRFHLVYPVLNPTYLYDEVWPGNHSALAIWRASLIFSGLVSGLIMTAMFLTSFPIIRRKYFNVFYFTHLFGILAVVVVCLHASTMFYCTAPGLSMWLLDWGLRTHELRKPLDSRLRSLGKGWYSLTVVLPYNRLSGYREVKSPLAHFHIHHAATSKVELHPFTTTTHLASKEAFVGTDGREYIVIDFLFKEMESRSASRPLQPSTTKRKQWTSQLASLADADGSMSAGSMEKNRFSSDMQCIGFPYRPDSRDAKIETVHPVFRSRFEEIDLESPLPNLNLQEPPQALFEPHNTRRYSPSATSDSADEIEKHGYSSPSEPPTPPTRMSSWRTRAPGVDLITRLEGPYFTAANPWAYDTVVCLVAGTGVTGALAIAAGFRAQRNRSTQLPSPQFEEECRSTDNVKKMHTARCIIVWSVREDEYVEIPAVTELQNNGLDIRIHRTGGGAPRLNLPRALHEICGQDGAQTWAYVCGPKGFVSAAERACMSVSGLSWTTAT